MGCVDCGGDNNWDNCDALEIRIECPAPSTTISRYEKLDHLHFGPLFSGDDAGFVQ
jgi:hypothetical protein